MTPGGVTGKPEVILKLTLMGANPLVDTSCEAESRSQVSVQRGHMAGT